MTDQITIHLDKHMAPLILGAGNENLSLIEKLLGVSCVDRGNDLLFKGSISQLDVLPVLFDRLRVHAARDQEVSQQDIRGALRFIEGGSLEKDTDIVIKTKKKTIVPRSPNQARYLEGIMKYDMVFGLGPAGTGKTYLAVAQAVSMYLNGQVERLIFTRPAVEAGERLGFLPGDLLEKIDPYLRPIYDAMHDMLPPDFLEKKMHEGDIEIAPLAFMRGRTLSNAFVVLDEAQNTTTTQMKMFLTRMGENSKIVITGDLTQTDLPRGQVSGLKEASAVLQDVEEIASFTFSADDVVRHNLVGKIIRAYDAAYKEKE